MSIKLNLKTLFIILSIICIIIPTVIYGIALAKSLQFEAKCINYFELAADANSVNIAEKHLTFGIKYLEENGLIDGNTSIFVKKPTNDIGFWYDNLKSAQIQLQKLNEQKNLTELEESNTLMKLRETLLNSEGSVTHPTYIVFYPNHIGWSWTILLSWLLYIGAILLYAYSDEVKYRYQYRRRKI